jgi:hypothetical protein
MTLVDQSWCATQNRAIESTSETTPHVTPQVSPHVTPQVGRLLAVLQDALSRDWQDAGRNVGKSCANAGRNVGNVGRNAGNVGRNAGENAGQVHRAAMGTW